MGYLRQFTKLNRIILSGTLGAFAISTLAPLHAVPQTNGTKMHLSDVEFAWRIEKLIEKVKRYQDKGDSKKLTEVLFEIKREVEGYTGKKIDIEKQLGQLEQKVKAAGGKLDKTHVKQLKKKLKKQEKRSNHKATYLATCLELGVPYRAEEEALLYNTTYSMEKGSDGKNKEEDDDEFCVPVRVTIGVTVGLCGLFLLFVPLPICKQCAPYLIEAGIGLLVDQGIDKWEDKNQAEKNKKK